MIQRLKIAYRILFAKKYFYTDCEMVYSDNLNTKEALDIADFLIDISESATIQQGLLNEAKELIK